MKKLFIALLLLVSLSATADNGIVKETYIYSVKGTDTLRLDRYDIPAIKTTKPCVIFMFGGGFVGGKRNNEGYKKYFSHLAEKGYTVISIDYRLGLRNIGDAADIDPMRFVALLSNSITVAVEDLFDATSFIIGKAGEWNVDKNIIIASGSSAGAISVLHGEYAVCNKDKVTEKLPEGFRYAGIISFAGAIFSTNGDLKWKSSPAPIQLFHGDADSNVPFDKLEMHNIGFYGSKHIAGQLKAINSPHYFYKVENAAHEISNMPMKSNLNEIDTFLEQLVSEKKQLIINIGVTQIGKPEMKKDFELTDYIQSNFK